MTDHGSYARRDSCHCGDSYSSYGSYGGSLSFQSQQLGKTSEGDEEAICALSQLVQVFLCEGWFYFVIKVRGKTR